jgi:hypothetical protein
VNGRLSWKEYGTKRHAHLSGALTPGITYEGWAAWLLADLLSRHSLPRDFFTSSTVGLMNTAMPEFGRPAFNDESDARLHASSMKYRLFFSPCNTRRRGLFVVPPVRHPTPLTPSAMDTLYVSCAEDLTSQPVRCPVTAAHCVTPTLD